jgi:hypothetical protein
VTSTRVDGDGGWSREGCIFFLRGSMRR